MRRLLFLLVVIPACVVVPGGSADALSAGPWSRPVDGPVVRGFDPPATRFGPGHLGVDFGVPPGTPVRAAGDGTVVFAGRVGAGLHVVVLHPDDVRTTDSFLASIAVVRGQPVARGEVLGTTGGTGPQHSADVLHFGVRVGDEYIDPMLLFAPPDLGKLVHLAEPHGGAFGGPAEPSFPVAASAGEAAPLVAAIRVDARAPMRPPQWWPPPKAASEAAALGTDDPSPARIEPDAARSPQPASSLAPVPIVASSIGLAAATVAVSERRRRRRGRMPRRFRRRSREGGER